MTFYFISAYMFLYLGNEKFLAISISKSIKCISVLFNKTTKIREDVFNNIGMTSYSELINSASLKPS